MIQSDAVQSAQMIADSIDYKQSIKNAHIYLFIATTWEQAGETENTMLPEMVDARALILQGVWTGETSGLNLLWLRKTMTSALTCASIKRV